MFGGPGRESSASFSRFARSRDTAHVHISSGRASCHFFHIASGGRSNVRIATGTAFSAARGPLRAAGPSHEHCIDNRLPSGFNMIRQ
ncbi:MAG: hypothetical protein DCC65_13220 [Planctomycetota bacterium]|nr:MAG: hypothetical protein DCC65_13220 [Planctomycetota bacterium]